jgi:hypothetical protein
MSNAWGAHIPSTSSFTTTPRFQQQRFCPPAQLFRCGDAAQLHRATLPDASWRCQSLQDSHEQCPLSVGKIHMNNVVYPWQPVIHMNNVVYPWQPVIHMNNVVYPWQPVIYMNNVVYPWQPVIHMNNVVYPWQPVIHMNNVVYPWQPVIHMNNVVYPWQPVIHMNNGPSMLESLPLNPLSIPVQQHFEGESSAARQRHAGQ